MFSALQHLLIREGISEAAACLLASIISVAVLLAIAILTYILASRPGMRVIERVVLKTKFRADDHLLQAGFFRRLARLVPLTIVYALLPAVLPNYPVVTHIIQQIIAIGITIITFTAVHALLAGVNAIYEDTEGAREVPIKGFLQGFEVIIFLVCTILIIATVLNKTPLYLLSGLGALTAVLMLIFKDAILGFVAGIQLAGNRMVAKGDWISMPQYGADGDVIDVALTTVKVQNWDKTVTTIPTYALISESFSNWRGMFDSGGRRIKRSINIDISTISLCTPDMLERYAKIEHIKDYLDQKQAELKAFNADHGGDATCRVNGRRLTNIGTFRAYIAAYLQNRDDVNKDLTFLIRQLQPTQHGLPIEVYIFTKSTAWAVYEGIQADIFDHLLAVAPEFDLRIFQAPSGADIRDALIQQRD